MRQVDKIIREQFIWQFVDHILNATIYNLQPNSHSISLIRDSGSIPFNPEQETICIELWRDGHMITNLTKQYP